MVHWASNVNGSLGLAWLGPDACEEKQIILIGTSLNLRNMIQSKRRGLLDQKNIVIHDMVYSGEGRITECLAMLHMGWSLSLIVILNVQNFVYEITLGLVAAKITDYIKKHFK